MGTPERELSALAKAYGGTRESYREESPQTQIHLAAFAIAATPVTHALYASFVTATNAHTPIVWRDAQPAKHLHDYPVVDVSWEDAHAFCAWLNETTRQNAGSRFRLPTEAEWERAARGTDGRTFPWGNTWDDALANTREAGLANTSVIGAFPRGVSPAGCLDMAGNVWEWTSSLDRAYPYDPRDGREDAGAAGRRILRGGCYANPHGYARAACRFRLAPTVRNEFLGFRLAY